MIKNIVGFRNELEKINEWWITKKVKEAERFPFKREIFQNVKKELQRRRVTIVLGPRRVGKSVLLKQCIEFLIKSGVNPRNILYYSLDDPTLLTYTDNLMKDVIDYFSDKIAKKGKKYIFFDEVHRYKGWYKWIKAYYDEYPEIKFILSGSSTLALQEDANRYLRGRTIEIEMFPLNFREFLMLSGIDVKQFKLEIDELDEFEVKRIWHKVKDAFEEYLLVGGFPEWFEIRGMDDAMDRWFRMLVNDIPKKAIYEDIVNLFGIRNPRFLELIFAFIAANQSRILAYETINDVAKLDRATLINYLEFLKASYLLIEILKFAGVKEQMKAKKKFLIVDQGLRNAILKDYEIREENIGFVIENLIGARLFFDCKQRGENLFYWRINEEVDFVIRGVLPVEIKYRDWVSNGEIKGLLEFMEKFNYDRGMVITRDTLKREMINGKKVSFIPAWLFLLCKLK